MAVRKNSKSSGRLVGTHQKLDKCAIRLFNKVVPRGTKFPNEQDILYFEGSQGPDGLKRKSPGVDEPMHFIQPENDDGELIRMILDHQYNLREALHNNNRERAAFEAAWMAHAITDGLTPAHHYPLMDATEDMLSENEFVKIFGVPVKGLKWGENWREILANNWLYLGAGGFMTKHIAFEYGCAITASVMTYKAMTPNVTKKDVEKVNLEKEFRRSLDKIASLDMYERFLKKGWTTDLAFETKEVLLPEIVRAIVMGWASAL